MILSTICILKLGVCLKPTAGCLVDFEVQSSHDANTPYGPSLLPGSDHPTGQLGPPFSIIEEDGFANEIPLGAVPGEMQGRLALQYLYSEGVPAVPAPHTVDGWTWRLAGPLVDLHLES